MAHVATRAVILIEADDPAIGLVLRPGVVADFAFIAIPQPHDPDAPLVPVCSRLATAS